MQSRQPYEIYEDRRKYPRIIINSPVEVRFQDKTLQARVHDLSPDGLQIRCSRATLREIRPSGRAIKKDNAPVVDVRFALAVSRAEQTIEATAALYYFVLLPGEKGEDVACGLEFRELVGKSRESVDAFIVDAMTPVESKVLDFLSEPRTPREIAEHVGAGTQILATLLAELVDDGRVLCIERNRQVMHVRPAAAMKALFERTEDLEARVARLERATRRTSKG
ncbi:MAG: PilZ domain-containing protein [Gammaproteobacteria bacterium]|nr:PilZ domain-containing protein [Gammaproteobacteria bacterium]